MYLKVDCQTTYYARLQSWGCVLEMCVCPPRSYVPKHTFYMLMPFLFMHDYLGCTLIVSIVSSYHYLYESHLYCQRYVYAKMVVIREPYNNRRCDNR